MIPPRFIVLAILSITGLHPLTAAGATPGESSSATAPSLAARRVLAPVEESQRVILSGNLHPMIQAASGQRGMAKSELLLFNEVDLGVVEDSLNTGRMLLLLQRSPEQEAALRDFIQAAHTPGSPTYHQWMTPEEFGRIYGPDDSDVAAVTAWMESHGLTINKIHAGKVAIEFSGSAGQVGSTFQTEIHRYQVNGATHLANATDPSVPAALAPVIAGLAPVNDFHPQSHLKVLGQAQFNANTHQATPQWSYPSGGGVSLALAPGDFATQYDINSVHAAMITGTGQSIAIISASNVDLSLVQNYQSLFNLNANLPQVVIDGSDPGANSAATEAYLDIEVADSIAPGAAILLYTSGGTALTDGLALAALRAVEDDQAGVISVSYGECEMDLGQSGNAFWNALWQQAAAQGQSVFVAAGDGGSAGCDNFDSQQVAYGGLQVNGLASTPYNIAVGGTDFYYSQYASSLSTYWTMSTTTSPAVSLRQAIPEQAWNDFFGFNIYDNGTPEDQSSENIIAGGGGASSDALYTNGVGAGYAKPAWQSGSGVPADNVRDLPDVSLFAANGYNDSYYPICANPGDCSSANLNSSGAVVITGVGGTSASTPAMAAIQTLVNQSTGSWQGQADSIYYPLASKQLAIFRDVTLGSNSVLCYPGTANCVIGSSITNSSGFTVESGYSANAGYDRATGLGSVDVANLIQNWNSVTLTPTTTTLNVSPSSIVHGQTVSITGTVARTTGSGTPTGSVSLTSNDALTHYASVDNSALFAGSYYSAVDNLPGGTYQLTADYGGDSNFASSKSAPVTVTVTPENDTLAATGWAWNPYDLYLYSISSGITLPYGAQIFLDAQPLSTNATLANQPTSATGTVTFTDTLGAAVTSSTQPLNSAGIAEWSTGVFAPGSHTISESYSGDASYNPSSVTAAASFLVIPGSTSLTVKPLVATVTAGASVAVDVQLNTGYLSLYGTPPTGSVTVMLGGKTATASWQAFGSSNDANMEAIVTFNNVAAGILPLTATYAGDGNWLGSAANGGTVIALSSKLTPTVTLASSLSSVTSGQSFTLTATVTGKAGMPTPTGTILFLADDQSFSLSATLSNGSASITVPSYAAANGANLFTAVYQGDGNYNSAASNPVSIVIAQSDFSLIAQNAELAISPSGSGSETLSLAPINGYYGIITLSISAPAGITVTPAMASPTVSAPFADLLTINVASTVAAGIYPLTITASGGGRVHTAQILVQVLVVAAPVFSPAPGIYASIQTVTITDATTNATIYYTTNGSAPTASSTKYTGAITVSSSETLAAVAIVSGKAPSSITTAAYTIAIPTATPAFSLASGTYLWSQTLTITDTTPNAVIYYTTNGSTPTTGSTVYTGPITVWSPTPLTETVQAIAVASGFATSPVTSATYVLAPYVVTPIFTPAGGSYASAQSVVISTTTPNATIYYTTNGSAPNTGSTKYTGPITVSSSETIQSFAGSPGYANSIITSATYTINSSITAAPAFSLASGTYLWSQTLTITDTTPNAVIYYTTNGSTPTTSSTVYTGPITVWSPTPLTETVQAIAVASGFAPSSVTSATYVLAPYVATPIFTPAGGSYASAQSVVISTTTPNATIYYTTNGSAPNTGSTKYTGPITVSSSETIQSFAGSPGYANSIITSATYTINSSITAAPAFSLASGTYLWSQTLTITDATPNAVIYYTTNGSTPTTGSTVYTGPITVWSPTPLTETVQAIAVASGFAPSSVTSATYVLAPYVATPIFTPAAGSYSSAQSVVISTTTPNATIYYTTNGSAPNTGSTKYTGPITVSSSETIQSFAGSPGYANSIITSATYTINSTSGSSTPKPRPPSGPQSGSRLHSDQ
ncbi:MAG: chitobiase/beta-hexosaminidase C-terminal domain-containing protein [Terracidiphilus sp.]